MFKNEKKTSRNFEIWVEKKMRVELKKKKKYSSRERENADQLCCQSISSLHRYEASIQSSGLLTTKYCRFFSSLLVDLSRTWKGSLVQLHMTVQSSYLGALTSTKWGTLATGCAHVVKILWDLRLFRNREVHRFYVKSDWNRTHRFNHKKPSREFKSHLAEIQITKPKHNLSRKNRQALKEFNKAKHWRAASTSSGQGNHYSRHEPDMFLTRSPRG